MLAVLLACLWVAPDVPRIAHSATTVGKSVYVVGGSFESGGKAFNARVLAYDTDTRVWSDEGPAPLGRAFSQAATIGGKVYVVGGLDDDGRYLARLDRFDPATRRWQSLAPLAVARTRFGAAVWREKMIVAGGYGGTSDRALRETELVELYDPASNKWSRLPDLPERSHAAGVAVVGDDLWVVGGYAAPATEPTKHTWRLRLPDGKWEPAPPLNHARVWFALAVHGNDLVAVGSGTHPAAAAPERMIGGKWTALNPPDHPTRRFASTVVGGRLFTFGGDEGEGVRVFDLRSHYWVK